MARKKTIYLDHAAATPVREEVLKTMQSFFGLHFGNPAGLYSEGKLAQKVLAESRKSISDILGAQPDTIIFTSGGTESDNLAIFGTADANREKGRHLITIGIEHQAVLEPLRQLEKQGWSVTFLPTDKAGLIDPEKVINSITPQTVLITIMYANNEIGIVEPIAELGKRIMRYRAEHKSVLPYFHTDACQAAGYLDLSVERLHVDLMSLNSGKIYGPKGVGLLYVRRGVKLQPRQFGGSQENGRRAGTENIAGIVGFTMALELAQKEKDKESARLSKLTSYFWKQLQKNFPSSRLNGPIISDNRLPNNLNVTFPGMDGEKFVIYLDNEGVMCSTASACSAISDEPSHVLCALQIPATDIKSTLRFSLGKTTTKQDVDYTIRSLIKIQKLLAK